MLTWNGVLVRADCSHQVPADVPPIALARLNDLCLRHSALNAWHRFVAQIEEHLKLARLAQIRLNSSNVTVGEKTELLDQLRKSAAGLADWFDLSSYRREFLLDSQSTDPDYVSPAEQWLDQGSKRAADTQMDCRILAQEAFKEYRKINPPEANLAHLREFTARMIK